MRRKNVGGSDGGNCSLNCSLMSLRFVDVVVGFFFTEIGELPAQLALMKKTIIRLVFDLNQIKITKKGNFTAIKWPMLSDPFNSFTVVLECNPL